MAVNSERAMKLLAASARLVKESAENGEKTIASPCMAVCQMDESSGLCIGCLRTLDEIARWGQADAPAKLAVWERIGARVAALGKASD